MSYQIQIRGRTGCIVQPEWVGAAPLEARSDTFDTLEQALAFAREHVLPRCDYAVRILGSDGRTTSVRRQQPSPSLAGPARKLRGKK